MAVIGVKVRPISNTDKNDSLKGASRIYVSKDNLHELTGTALENGGPCVVEKTLGDGQVIRREATLWAAPGNLSRSVAQMSKPFQDACGFTLGDDIRIIYTKGSTISDAVEVLLEDVTENEEPISDEDRPHWEWLIKGRLVGLGHAFPGLKVKRVFSEQVYRTFNIKSVNGSGVVNARFDAKSTEVHVRTAKDVDSVSEGTAPKARPARLQIDLIPGLEEQIRTLNKLLLAWSRPLRAGTSSKSCGLIIHGGHGTGKTLLLNQLRQTEWGTVYTIQPNEKLDSIKETLKKAKVNQPSIIIMDQFEQLIYSEKERASRFSVINHVGEFLDSLWEDSVAQKEHQKVVVVAASLDYMELPISLTQLNRFDMHIHLPLPDINRRRAILSTYDMPLHPESRQPILTKLAEQTHAYNGKDLDKLIYEAVVTWDQRLDELENEGTTTPDDYYISIEQFRLALTKIRPSAMRDVNLKPPPVHWDDIGGQEEVKASLQEAIQLATEPRNRILSYTPDIPNGFLLYGPPGCSKTMAAQALATEADLNFFAVKGAELLNMYVGESERKVRQLFQRARDAAPSIIFFDEIDSIGGQRSGFGGGAASSGGSGLNVLTTLLNEMQGFEQTKGVLVLAATNRPQALDPALLRPGRFDKLIYVTPPDEAARAAIFRKFAAPPRRIAADFDVEALARATAGFSGAEISKICSEAGLAAWRRDRGSGDDQDEGEGIVFADFQRAMENTPRMITEEMLRGYENWAGGFLKGPTVELPVRTR